MDKRKALIAATACAAVAVLAAALGLQFRNRLIAASTLPALPELTGRPPAMLKHLREADAAARSRPNSADAVGALGAAYHSDLFYVEAESAYSRASELDPKNWRWPYSIALLHIERGEASSAARALRTAVGINPGLGLAWL